MFKKFQFVAQIVGFTTMTLLAVYGLLSLLGGGVAWAAALGETRAAAPSAIISPTFNYQGFLRNSDGSLATGSYTVTARIYDTLAPNVTALYTETFSSVTVRDGWFNIALGRDDAQNPNLPGVFNSMPRYIGITLEGLGDELIPRQRFHTVPWALYATTASQANDFTITGLLTATTITASGPARVAGLTANGNVNVNGGLTVNGNVDVNGGLTVTQFLSGPTIEKVSMFSPVTDTVIMTSTLNLKRYVFKTKHHPNSNSVSIPLPLIRELCADMDGCEIRLGQSRDGGHDYGRVNFSQWMFSMGGDQDTWPLYWVAHRLDDDHAYLWDTDDNNAEAWLSFGGCYFGDPEWVNGVGDDTEPGFGLVAWGIPNQFCVLVIDD